jgi:hypothetical protein
MYKFLHQNPAYGHLIPGKDLWRFGAVNAALENICTVHGYVRIHVVHSKEGRGAKVKCLLLG